MTPDEREDLADQLRATEAPTLAAAVHRRDLDTIAGILDRLDRQGLYALAVVLAAEIVIDDVAVERVAVDGEPARLTRAERAAAVALLADRGLTQTGIADQLRLNGVNARRLYRAIPRNQHTTEGNAA